MNVDDRLLLILSVDDVPQISEAVLPGSNIFNTPCHVDSSYIQALGDQCLCGNEANPGDLAG